MHIHFPICPQQALQREVTIKGVSTPSMPGFAMQLSVGILMDEQALVAMQPCLLLKNGQLHEGIQVKAHHGKLCCFESCLVQVLLTIFDRCAWELGRS